jgi:hypothetical protein
MTADQPTLPLADPSAAPAAPRRQPRRWPWLVGLLIVVVLMFVAWFAGEQIARSIVERTIREQAITQLALPADQQIDVDVASPVLLPLLAGNLGAVRVASDDVPIGDTTADVVVEAQDVPIRGGGDWSGAYATVTLDEPQLQGLLESIDGFPATTVAIDQPDVEATFELDALVTKVPVGVAFEPRAEGGDLVLTPSSLRVAGAEVSAEAILRQFGAIASTVVRDWDVCIAQYLPEAVTLTDVSVARTTVVAQFEIDSSVLRDDAARQKGSCD